MIKYVEISTLNLHYEFQACHHLFLRISDLIKNTACSQEIQLILLYESKSLFDFLKQQNKLIMDFFTKTSWKSHTFKLNGGKSGTAWLQYCYKPRPNIFRTIYYEKLGHIIAIKFSRLFMWNNFLLKMFGLDEN